MDYYRDWTGEFYTWTSKYKNYWGPFKDFMDDYDEENYRRIFLPPDASSLSYTAADCEFFRVSKEDYEFFRNLISGTKQVVFDANGAGTVFRYTIVVEVAEDVFERPEITVLSHEGMYTICENLVNKKIYDKKEDAGAYILKWILEHID